MPPAPLGEGAGEPSSSSKMGDACPGARRSPCDENDRGIAGMGGAPAVRLEDRPCPWRLYSLFDLRGRSAPASSRPADEPELARRRSPERLRGRSPRPPTLLALLLFGLRIALAEGLVDPGVGLVIF